MYRIILVVLFLLAGTLAQADDDANAKLFEIHSRSANKGSSEAQFKLGEMCEEGRGTPRDLDKAREWYELAAKQGHAEAKQRLVTLGKRKPRDDEQKMAQEAQLLKQHAEEERRNALAQKREEDERRTAEDKRRAEELSRQKAEADRLRQIQAQKRVDEEERARLAALARKQEEEKAQSALRAQPAPQTPPPVPQPQKTKAATESSATTITDKQESFEADPCKGPAARFMSTCR